MYLCVCIYIFVSSFLAKGKNCVRVCVFKKSNHLLPQLLMLPLQLRSSKCQSSSDRVGGLSVTVGAVVVVVVVAAAAAAAAALVVASSFICSGRSFCILEIPLQYYFRRLCVSFFVLLCMKFTPCTYLLFTSKCMAVFVCVCLPVYLQLNDNLHAIHNHICMCAYV